MMRACKTTSLQGPCLEYACFSYTKLVKYAKPKAKRMAEINQQRAQQ